MTSHKFDIKFFPFYFICHFKMAALLTPLCLASQNKDPLPFLSWVTSFIRKLVETVKVVKPNFFLQNILFAMQTR